MRQRQMLFEEQGFCHQGAANDSAGLGSPRAEQSRYRVKSENKQHKNTLARWIARSGR